MIGQAKDHRGRALCVAAAVNGGSERLAQGSVRAEPVVLEQRQRDGGIPGGRVFGEGVRLAGEAPEPVTQHPVEPLEVDGVRLSDGRPDGRPDLDLD